MNCPHQNFINKIKRDWFGNYKMPINIYTHISYGYEKASAVVAAIIKREFGNTAGARLKMRIKWASSY